MANAEPNNLNNSFQSRTLTTDLRVKAFGCFTWIIENFQYSWLFNSIKSEQFRLDDQPDITFRLELTCYSLYYEIALIFSTKNVPKVGVEASILNSAGEEAIIKKGRFDPSSSENEYNPLEIVVQKDFLFDQSNKLLLNNKLTIVYKLYKISEIGYYNISPPNEETKKIAPQRHSAEPSQLKEFEPFLENVKHSDFKLIVSGAEFPVHKIVMAARSPVFASMLEQNRETSDGEVEIVGIAPETAREMLRFIYTGKVNDIERLAPELVIAADRYELDELRSLCQEIIISNLSLENLQEMLIIFDKNNIPQLRTAMLEFVSENSNVLNDSEEFKKVIKTLSASFLADIVKTLLPRK